MCTGCRMHACSSGAADNYPERSNRANSEQDSMSGPAAHEHAGYVKKLKTVTHTNEESEIRRRRARIRQMTYIFRLTSVCVLLYTCSRAKQLLDCVLNLCQSIPIFSRLCSQIICHSTSTPSATILYTSLISRPQNWKYAFRPAGANIRHRHNCVPQNLHTKCD